MSRFPSAIARLAPMVLLGASPVFAQAPTPIAAEAPARPDRSDEPTPIASTRSSGTITARSVPSLNPLRASGRVDGTPSPGLQMTLDGSSSAGGRMWYRWLQTQGPIVKIDDPTKAEAHFIVPADATLLGFVLVVGNATGVDARSFLIEVEDPDREADGQALKADAGDDQTARVGRKVVLNGVRSEPRGKLRFRWVQAGGPRVALQAGDGPTASFVPEAPGTYRFALVVATTGGALSEASTVSVKVGGATRSEDESQAMAIDELARVSLASIEGGARFSDDLSRVFDVVADRIDTYRSFSEASAEMTRRLDAVVPREKDRRAVWIEQLFTPLMAKLAAGMKSEGLDLTQPESQGKPLTKVQRTRLAEQFRYTAAGLRATRTLR